MKVHENSNDFSSADVRQKVYKSKHEQEQQAIKGIDAIVADAEARRKKYKNSQPKTTITR